MAITLIVADEPDGLVRDRLAGDLPPQCRVVSPDDLLDGHDLPQPDAASGVTVVNLCRDQRPCPSAITSR